MKNAFTMIEIVFVIVVLGILAAVAIPKMTATRTDATIAKLRSEVASIRSAIINERQSRMMNGDSSYISKLDDLAAATSSDGDPLFRGDGTRTLLDYPIYANSANGWSKTAANTYKANFGTGSATFTYDSSTGVFDCTHTNDGCKKLTH